MKKDDLFDLDVQVKEVNQLQPDFEFTNLGCSVTFCNSSCC
ncbi:FDLD family class I lanthipeptide [Brevibacillus laterosporus]|nr:FDLD family class I lanthipeptide [Brevibacillus laterosporus]